MRGIDPHTKADEMVWFHKFEGTRKGWTLLFQSLTQTPHLLIRVQGACHVCRITGLRLPPIHSEYHKVRTEKHAVLGVSTQSQPWLEDSHAGCPEDTKAGAGDLGSEPVKDRDKMGSS